MESSLLKKIIQAVRQQQSYAFATIVESTDQGTARKVGAKMIVLSDGTIAGTVGGGADELKAYQVCLAAVKTGKQQTIVCRHYGRPGQPICGGAVKIFIEPFAPMKHLVICGAGHIALPLSAIAKILNFSVTVVDDRGEYANKKRFPHVDKIHADDFVRGLSGIEFNHNTFVVIVTYGHKYDFDCLRAVISSNAGYIGLIGSQVKREKFFKQLKHEGVAQERIKRVKIPAGLDIGSQTPEEIAVSIMAEVIWIQNKEFVGTSKFESKRD